MLFPKLLFTKWTMGLVLCASIWAHAQYEGGSAVYPWAMDQDRPSIQIDMLLQKDASQQGKPTELDQAVFFTLNTPQLLQVVQQAPDAFLWNLPTPNGEHFTLRLYKVNILTDDYRGTTAVPVAAPYEHGIHYRGAIEGQAGSWASISLFKGEIYGLIANADGNWNLGAVEHQPTRYILYNDHDLKANHPFHCATSDEGAAAPLHRNNTTATLETLASCKTVRLYWEADYQLYVNKGSNVTTTTNFLTAVFAQMTTLYANDSIKVQLAGTNVWNATDPFPNTSSTDALTAFKGYWNGLNNAFNANFAMLVTLDARGNGGLAYRGPGYCVNDYAYAYAEISSGYSSVPTYSWTVEVLTHETGHNLASPHTHACSWNGNNTPIDSCGPTYNAQYAEGTCTNVSNPTAAVGGTIMSYCHLLSSVGIKFVNGFGPQPQRMIVAAINNTSCVTGDVTPLAYYTQQVNGNVVQFTSNVPNATSVLWNFGNSQTSTSPSLSYTYNNTGTFKVCLKATNTCGSTQYCKDVVISSLANDAFDRASSGHWTQSNVGRLLTWSQAPDQGSFTLKVYNTLGQQIGQKQLTSTDVQWDASAFAPGLYLMQMQSEAGTFVQKVWLH